MPIRRPPKKALCFMKFPPEIRELIYGYLLLEQDPIAISQHRTKVGSSFLRLSPLCKSLNQEINAFFYSQNTFHIGDHIPSPTSPSARGLHKFLRRVPKESLACITKLQLTITFSQVHWHWDETREGNDWAIGNRKDLKWLETTFAFLLHDFASLGYLELRDRIVKRPPHYYFHSRRLTPEMSFKALVGVLKNGLLPLRERRGFDVSFVSSKYWVDGEYFMISQLQKALDMTLGGSGHFLILDGGDLQL